MSLPFDATLKEMAASCPEHTLALCGHPVSEPITVLNVDLSTVTTSTDAVFGIGETLHEVVHVDFQASASARKHRDVMVYNSLLHRDYDVPVSSIVLLLRRQAGHYNLRGEIRYRSKVAPTSVQFRYAVIRLWQQPVDPVLNGPLEMLPLAPLCRMARGVSLKRAIGSVVQRMDERLREEADEHDRRELLTKTFTLAGLRLPREVLHPIFIGAMAMEESSTYRWIVEQGEIKALRRSVLASGRKKFGEADEVTRGNIGGIDNLDELNSLVERVHDVDSWEELLNGS